MFGYLGPNGSGKTTTIRLLLGLHRPTPAGAELFGVDAWRDAVERAPPGRVRRGRAVAVAVAHGRGDARATWRAARRRRTPPTATRSSSASSSTRDKKVRALSKGNRQKVQLVAAFAGRADLLILDEPTSGLDPLMEVAFRETVREAKDRGQTVFLSSHILSEVEALCDRVGILRAGRLVEQGTLAELRHLSAQTVEVTFAGPAPSPAGAARRARRRRAGAQRAALRGDRQRRPARRGAARAPGRRARPAASRRSRRSSCTTTTDRGRCARLDARRPARARATRAGARSRSRCCSPSSPRRRARLPQRLPDARRAAGVRPHASATTRPCGCFYGLPARPADRRRLTAWRVGGRCRSSPRCGRCSPRSVRCAPRRRPAAWSWCWPAPSAAAPRIVAALAAIGAGALVLWLAAVVGFLAGRPARRRLGLPRARDRARAGAGVRRGRRARQPARADAARRARARRRRCSWRVRCCAWSPTLRRRSAGCAGRPRSAGPRSCGRSPAPGRSSCAPACVATALLLLASARSRSGATSAPVCSRRATARRRGWPAVVAGGARAARPARLPRRLARRDRAGRGPSSAPWLDSVSGGISRSFEQQARSSGRR